MSDRGITNKILTDVWDRISEGRKESEYKTWYTKSKSPVVGDEWIHNDLTFSATFNVTSENEFSHHVMSIYNAYFKFRTVDCDVLNHAWVDNIGKSAFTTRNGDFISLFEQKNSFTNELCDGFSHDIVNDSVALLQRTLEYKRGYKKWGELKTAHVVRDNCMMLWSCVPKDAYCDNGEQPIDFFVIGDVSDTCKYYEKSPLKLTFGKYEDGVQSVTISAHYAYSIRKYWIIGSKGSAGLVIHVC